MSVLSFFRKRKQVETKPQLVSYRLSPKQTAVYRAVKEIQYPVTGRSVASYMGWDSASVTNRLSELVGKGYIKVAYIKKGLDHVTRKYYVVVK